MRSRDPRLSAVESYSDAFRDLVNDRVSWKGEPARKLRLNTDEDWSFVCVAMDILGDASLALHNFLEFGIDGPTKYEYGRKISKTLRPPERRIHSAAGRAQAS